MFGYVGLRVFFSHILLVLRSSDAFRKMLWALFGVFDSCKWETLAKIRIWAECRHWPSKPVIQFGRSSCSASPNARKRWKFFNYVRPTTFVQVSNGHRPFRRLFLLGSTFAFPSHLLIDTSSSFIYTRADTSHVSLFLAKKNLKIRPPAAITKYILKTSPS